MKGSLNYGYEHFEPLTVSQSIIVTAKIMLTLLVSIIFKCLLFGSPVQQQLCVFVEAGIDYIPVLKLQLKCFRLRGQKDHL